MSVLPNDLFRKVASTISRLAGHPITFLTAVTLVIVWAASGRLFQYSDTWQLVINTSTTIITFLMVFLIQNTQNRDSKALHIKLDELIRTAKGARESFVDIENMSDEDLDKMNQEFHRLHEKAQTVLQKRSQEKSKKKSH